MQVIFLHQNSFLVEVDQKVLIFDYFQGDRINGYHFAGKIPTYREDVEMILFSSHANKDHFDPSVLKMAEDYPNIRYVFSKDIKIKPKALKEQGIDPKVREKITFVGPDKEIRMEALTASEQDALTIRTFRALGQGVAFYVTVSGITLFHSGALGDGSMDHVGDLINGKNHREYRKQIRRLQGKPLNLAFVPMDPRLGTHQCESMDFFLKTTDAEYVFPMSMWQDYSGIEAYRKRVSNRIFSERLIETERENQVFMFGEDE